MNIIKKIFLPFAVLVFLFHTYCFSNDKIPIEDLEDTNYDFSSVSSSLVLEPITYSKNIIVLDRKSKIPLYEKEPYRRVPMASTTKIMTCIIVLENSSLAEIVSISEEASSVSGSTLGLIKNMKISMNDLLYGLMLCSGNDCAMAIAEHISGSIEEFVKLMNKKAADIDLSNTNFVTPHGLDDDSHFTTAYDLAILTDYALNNETFKKIVSTKNHTITFNGYPKNISNTNELLGLNGVYGVKTGFTFNAGRCLVSACKRDNLDIIVVVLGANTKKARTLDSSNLINYVFNNYNYFDISDLVYTSFENYTHYLNNNITLIKTSTIPVLELSDFNNKYYPLLTNGSLKLCTKIYTLNAFSPKIIPGTVVGNLYVYNNNNLLCSINIMLKNTLSNNTWQFYYKKIFDFF